MAWEDLVDAALRVPELDMQLVDAESMPTRKPLITKSS
jgi:hypothetical protein